MKLSVIVVSYNVRYFLEKCIDSVLKALNGIESEVIVIDNNSVDTSVEMIKSRFPQVQLIVNKENTGFAKACNQGLRICNGNYALLLNPDTLVSEDTFRRCIDFMDTHKEASACGVRMVDGTGRFLPESMRGLPSPLSAFFKMTGLAALFPKSMFFNGYYMGGFDPDMVHAVPVLTGAFMFMRMSVIREIGMLDEDYFMYGEDIDLCHRMIKANYVNYYLPEPAIIHYKGESTHRDSIKYVINFYNAMLIYVSKHLHGAGSGFFRLMIMLGVLVRGLVGGTRRVLERIVPVITDALLIVSVLWVVTKVWARNYFHNLDHFDKDFYRTNLLLYSGIWLFFLFLFGAYDRQRNSRTVLYAIAFGTLAILIIYAVLPLQYRSSRAVILITALVLLALMTSLTIVINRIRKMIQSRKPIAIVGGLVEGNRIMELMNRIDENRVIAGRIAVDEEENENSAIGHLTQLTDLLAIHKIGELIFSAKDLSFGEINAWMTRLGPSMAYRIASSGSDHIVGSDSKKEQGTLYAANIEFALAYPAQRRSKRIFDLIMGLLLFPLLILLSVFRKNARRNLNTVVLVLIGEQTFIGYNSDDRAISELPRLRRGFISIGGYPSFFREQSEIHMINYIYAREYTVWKDIDLVMRNFSKLI